jgi:hypothetical protein
MIAVRDSNNYTPLHIVAFFLAATTTAGTEAVRSTSTRRGESTEEAVVHNNMGRSTEGVDGIVTIPPAAKGCTSSEVAAVEENSVMSLFCDTAIMVEQELGRARGKQQDEEKSPLLEGTSPLYLAAKKGAPISILKILLETRSRTNWIAPSTGGEPYWYGNDTAIGTNETTAASFSSPLEIMLREDRLRSSMNSSCYRNDAYLLGEEEDGNILRRRRTSNSSNRSTPTVRSSESSIRVRNREQRSPLHPDEILGVPHLVREMRRMAINRCREHYYSDNGNKEHGHIHVQREYDKATGCDGNISFLTKVGTSIATPTLFTQSQQRCLELWEKCIELLVTAGGGGIPLLQIEEEQEDRYLDKMPLESKQSNCGEDCGVPYGILHACVCCKVPIPSLVEIALILFPEQASKRDSIHGMIPLHHVLRAEHKYSYATSNLLAILLKGRLSTISTRLPRSPNTTRKSKKPDIVQPQQQLPTESAAVAPSNRGRMPEVPSLSSNTTYFSSKSKNTAPSPHLPNARSLQNTVILPFPFIAGFSNSTIYCKEEHSGPIPLVFAIHLGLSMEAVINKLLEADSHESLRTPDPLTQLPPFALVATKVCLSKEEEEEERQQLGPTTRNNRPSDSICRQKIEVTTTTSTNARRRRELPANDVIAMAIGSTINVLSSGDASNDFVAARYSPSPPAMITSSVAGSSNHNSSLKNNDSKSVYNLDDVYRLLLAHPQVLAQYAVG